MNKLVWLLQWILKAAIFFTLFAFALNNQDDAVVHLFFGTQWRAPMVLILLWVFALGLAVGALAMVPRWWRQRRLARQSSHAAPPPVATPPSDSVVPPASPDSVYGR